MVYYYGETLPYHQALAREKSDWLRRYRTYLAENKERKNGEEAAQKQQQLFRERADGRRDLIFNHLEQIAFTPNVVAFTIEILARRLSLLSF